MAEYFKYTATYNNTLVDRSDTTFSPVPPYGELLSSYYIVPKQELYYYRVSGSTIVLNDQVTIDAYLESIESPAGYLDNVQQDEFTGETTNLQTQITNISGTTANLDLQDVTDNDPTTTNESTFSGGLKTMRIKPVSGDTTTAIQVQNITGEPIINIDTVSGHTGFGTTAPRGIIHTYDTDDSGTTDMSHSGVIVDGVVGVDKNIAWAEGNTDRWDMGIDGDEDGEFMYLHAHEADKNPLTIMDTGRIGFNKQTNVLSPDAARIVGTGLNKLHISGTYTENYNLVYEVEISTNGTPDTFKWRTSRDATITFTAWSSNSDVTTTPFELEYGVNVNWGEATGHTIGDRWRFGAFSQIPQGTVTVAPMGVDEVATSSDYDAGTVIYQDITADANGGDFQNTFQMFSTGVTGTQEGFYFGTKVFIHSIYVYMSQGGTDMILILEYWNGSSWIVMDNVTNDLIDGTDNLSQSGQIIWTPSSMTGWVRDNIPDLPTEQYDQFWIRMRTSANPTIAPIGQGLSVGNDKRFSVYSSHNDYKPSMFVDSRGRTSLGGGNLSSNNLLQVGTADSTINSGDPGSQVQFNSEGTTEASVRLRNSNDNSTGYSIGFVKTRGTSLNPENSQTDDYAGSVIWSTTVSGVTPQVLLSEITTQYVGDGITKYGDLVFKTHGDYDFLFPTEIVRMTGKGFTGFGVSDPSALVHLLSGTTTAAPLKYITGDLLNSPEEGAVEFRGEHWYGTITGDTRKTFAFLESPVFTGNPELPTGTTINDENLIDFILESGGSSSDTFVPVTRFNTYTGDTDTNIDNIENDIIYLSGQTDTKLPTSRFNTYTGTTQPWSHVSKVGSSIADLETRDAADVDVSVPDWGVTNVNDFIQDSAQYTEETQGSGRISPETVLFGSVTDTLVVSGGTGYITYTDFHREITWTG